MYLITELELIISWYIISTLGNSFSFSVSILNCPSTIYRLIALTSCLGKNPYEILATDHLFASAFAISNAYLNRKIRV